MRRIAISLFWILLIVLVTGGTETASLIPLQSPVFNGGTLTQDTTLSVTSSPYLITQDIFVPNGIKLTLEPGVTLEFTQGRSIFIEGELEATGTSAQPITFTHDQAGAQWGAIGFWHTHADNRLTHGVIEYASGAFYNGQALAGVTVMTSTLTIKESEIRHIVGSAIRFVDAGGAILDSRVHDVSGAGNIDGINIVRGDVEVTGNHIYDGRDYFDAIDVDGDGTTMGLIRQNTLHGSANDCLDIDKAAPQIQANYIYDCADKGISLGVAARPVIVNNLIYNSNIGLASKDGSWPTLINNTIVNNTIGLDLYRKVTGLPGYATVYNSIIWGNDTAIRLRNGAEITITYSNVQTTTLWPGQDNVNADPHFRAPSAFDYRLASTSPCTDTADLTVAPVTDIQGVPRPHGDGVDMGAFEFFERVWLYLPVTRR